MSRNFVFSADNEDDCNRWISFLYRFCGIPFDKYQWMSSWGDEPTVPEYLKEYWISIRRNCPYRNSNKQLKSSYCLY